MKNLLKLTEYCDQSWNSTNFSPNFTILVFFSDILKFSIGSQIQNVMNAKFEQRWSWKIKKRSWISFLFKSVGALRIY